MNLGRSSTLQVQPKTTMAPPMRQIRDRNSQAALDIPLLSSRNAATGLPKPQRMMHKGNVFISQYLAVPFCTNGGGWSGKLRHFVTAAVLAVSQIVTDLRTG